MGQTCPQGDVLTKKSASPGDEFVPRYVPVPRVSGTSPFRYYFKKSKTEKDKESDKKHKSTSFPIVRTDEGEFVELNIVCTGCRGFVGVVYGV